MSLKVPELRFLMEGYNYVSVSILALDYHIMTLSFSVNEITFGECLDYDFSRYNGKFKRPEELPRPRPGV